MQVDNWSFSISFPYSLIKRHWHSLVDWRVENRPRVNVKYMIRRKEEPTQRLAAFHRKYSRMRARSMFVRIFVSDWPWEMLRNFISRTLFLVHIAQTWHSRRLDQSMFSTIQRNTISKRSRIPLSARWYRKYLPRKPNASRGLRHLRRHSLINSIFTHWLIHATISARDENVTQSRLSRYAQSSFDSVLVHGLCSTDFPEGTKNEY